MEKIDYSNLSGRLLELFIAIYDSSSVSTAASQFDLTQSTVSHSLAKLRACLGDPLFVKSGRGIVPTERASMLAPRIRAVLAEMEGLTEPDAYDPNLDRRPIAIAANVLELMPLCVDLQHRIIEVAPQTQLRFLELGSRDNIETLLDTQTVDLVVSVRPVQLAASLVSCELIAEDRVCYYDASVRGPVLSVEDYCASGHATLDFGFGKKSSIDALLDDMSLDRTISLCAPDVESLGQLIAGTSLLATMQTSLQQTSFKHLAYCEPPFSIPKHCFDLIWHRRSEQSGRNAWLRGLVGEAAKEA